MSAAIMAIAKLAAVKVSPTAQIRPFFRPGPNVQIHPSKDLRKEGRG
jgi:hypothetical protein